MENIFDALKRLGMDLGFGTGLEQVDRIIENGGFSPGELYEIVGKPGTGKTQVGFHFSFTCTDILIKYRCKLRCLKPRLEISRCHSN